MTCEEKNKLIVNLARKIIMSCEGETRDKDLLQRAIALALQATHASILEDNKNSEKDKNDAVSMVFHSIEGLNMSLGSVAKKISYNIETITEVHGPVIS